MTTPPDWVDDLFPFPTPEPLRVLIDIAWQSTWEFWLANEVFDITLLESHFGFMFDLAAIPRPPDGVEVYPDEPLDTSRRLAPPHYATPEFVPFGSLGDGGAVGWVVPAPELDQPEYPVAIASGHEPGVWFVGDSTRAGLEHLVSAAVDRMRSEPVPKAPDWRDPEVWREQNRWQFEARERRLVLMTKVVAELDLELSAPEPDGTWDVWVPDGWRHEPGADGIGVLAPADAFAKRHPVVGDEPELAAELITAEVLLDDGHPASALAVVKDVFVNGPSCWFASLRPLWARAYRDLGRADSAARLDLMTPCYPADSCFCPEH